MPRGGWRGGGRPTKEAAAAKAKALLETLENGKKIDPRAYLQAVLASPASNKSERLRAAELLLKAGPDPAPKGADIPPAAFNIWALPRGASISPDGSKVLWPDGSLTDPEPIEPYSGSPPISSPRRRREPEPVREPDPVPFETVEVEPPPNVTPLRPHERGLSFGARHDPQRTADALLLLLPP
jgi:hypothetical protein